MECAGGLCNAVSAAQILVDQQSKQSIHNSGSKLTKIFPVANRDKICKGMMSIFILVWEGGDYSLQQAMPAFAKKLVAANLACLVGQQKAYNSIAQKSKYEINLNKSKYLAFRLNYDGSKLNWYQTRQKGRQLSASLLNQKKFGSC
jgi:hypothetical protein